MFRSLGGSAPADPVVQSGIENGRPPTARDANHPQAIASLLLLDQIYDRDEGLQEFVPALNQIANFLDLSVLGSTGEGRRQTQVINKYDRLTYRGVATKHYEQAVKSAGRSIGGGDFGVVIDDTHTQHEISSSARALILKDLKR